MPVLSSSDQLKALETGVIPIPPEVQADNDARDGIKTSKPAQEGAANNGGSVIGATEVPPGSDESDDVEGEDGLTPRQKRDLTKKMQLSIGKKHRQLKEAEEFAAEQYNEKRLAEQAVEKLQREVQRLKSQGIVAEPVSEITKDRPQRGAFPSDQEYERAVIDWRVNAVLQERDVAEAKKRQTEEAERNTERLRARIEVARAVVPDFEEVTEAASDITVPMHIAEAMAGSDLFAELGYYLAKHPDEAKKIMELPPTKGLLALGKIEAIIKPFEKSKSNGSSKPSQDAGKPASVETGNAPSKPRAAAPIEPLATPSAPQSEAPVTVKNVRQEIDRWQKDRSGDLLRRKRH